MRWYEKAGAHILLFSVFAAVCFNIILLFHGRIGAWSLPLAYCLYSGGWLAGRWMLWRRNPSRRQVAAVVLLPLVFLVAAQLLGLVYDTSWDGQDYQQSGVIAFHQGWNPWYSDRLPMSLPQSAQYVVGYPKTTWLLQDSVYELTGRIQTATVMNFVMALAAGLLVYGVLVRLSIGKKWTLVLTVLAVVQIHFLQQLPTFLEDGYSYEVALAAIAALLLYMLENVSVVPLLAFLSAWILLAGSKFSNLFVCALLGAACLAYLIKIGAYKRPGVWRAAALFAVVAAIVLFVPFGTNSIRHGAMLYPQNESGASNKLLEDNVPNNLRQANRLELLFYGIFSHVQPSNAGDPVSPANTAQLKIPFTFEAYEFDQMNNFQGRVGSGGLLFSGVVVVAFVCYGAIAFRRKSKRELHLFAGVSVMSVLIVIAALVIPVSNKLRYSPLITLIPLLVLVLLVSSMPTLQRWLRCAAGVLLVCVVGNVAIALVTFTAARLHETAVISEQLAAMQQTNGRYAVEAKNLYSTYTRLQEHGIPFVISSHPGCLDTLEYTNWTTVVCRQVRR